MKIPAAMRSRVARLMLSAAAPLFVLVAAGVTFAPTASAASINGCTVSIENPHPSSSGIGILAKGRFDCTVHTSTIHIGGTRGTSFLLWLCPNPPQQDEAYLSNPIHGCSIKGSNTDAPVISNTGTTRYVPSDPGVGARGSGWWVACAVWYSSGPNGTDVGNFTTFSNVVQLSA